MPSPVSVIITCFNYAHLLHESVSSVMTQDSSDAHLIIVNDGSSDNTVEVCSTLQQHFGKDRISVIHQDNSGQPAIARNVGIAFSQSEYVVCLDADDLMAPSFIRKTKAALDASPEAVVAYTDALFFGENIEVEVMPAGFFSIDALKNANQLFCCSLFRRSAWRAAGGYSENVRGYEDWDFWISLAKAGAKGCKIQEPLFHYRVNYEGVYSDAVSRDRKLRAQIVLNHSTIYSPSTQTWARTLVADGVDLLLTPSDP